MPGLFRSALRRPDARDVGRVSAPMPPALALLEEGAKAQKPVGRQLPAG